MVLEERRVVGTGPERADAQFAAGPASRPPVAGAIDDLPRLPALPDRALRLRIFDVARHLVDEALERVRSADVQEAATVAVAVDVDHRLVAQLVVVLLDPLGRSEQRRLLAVPAGVDDGPLRPPALPDQLPERPRLLEHRGAIAADRIRRAVHPRVVMVAAHDPLIREASSRAASRSRRRVALRPN